LVNIYRNFRLDPAAAAGTTRTSVWALFMAHQTWLERIYAVESAVGAIVEGAPHVVQAVTEIAVAGAVGALPRP
jgi:hypothetical protein